MKAWLKRRRWWLLLALFFLGAAAFFLREVSQPDPMLVAYERIQTLMTPEQVDAVMVGRLSATRQITPLSSRRSHVEYHFQSGRVTLDFQDNRVAKKDFYYSPMTFWDRLRSFFSRFFPTPVTITTRPLPITTRAVTRPASPVGPR
jgi:hypothetical protein